jgi:D-beta-D-heptose 7-phosphate kinase/D-beta-D-heptose 1-phosphate adenosyltransferase
MGKDIILISGYFDPLHKGHLELIEQAKKEINQYAEVWIIVNSDEQAKLKKGKSFMEQVERIKIMSSLKLVDRVYLAIDKDRSVCETLKYIKETNPDNDFYFCNGGDVNARNCREHKICKQLGVCTIYGLGKKVQSSSWLTGLKSK